MGRFVSRMLTIGKVSKRNEQNQKVSQKKKLIQFHSESSCHSVLLLDDHHTFTLLLLITTLLLHVEVEEEEEEVEEDYSTIPVLIGELTTRSHLIGCSIRARVTSSLEHCLDSCRCFG